MTYKTSSQHHVTSSQHHVTPSQHHVTSSQHHVTSSQHHVTSQSDAHAEHACRLLFNRVQSMRRKKSVFVLLLGVVGFVQEFFVQCFVFRCLASSSLFLQKIDVISFKVHHMSHQIEKHSGQ